MTDGSRNQALRPAGRHGRARALALAAVLASVVVVVVVNWVRTGSGADRLQRYEDGLRARGEKLTYAELLGSNQPTSGQVFAELVSVARFPGSMIGHPSNLGLMEMVAPGRARPVGHFVSGEAGRQTGAKSNFAWADFAAAAEFNRVNLERLHEILRDPPADSGLVPSGLVGASQSTVFGRLFDGAKWLSALVALHLCQGRAEEATQDVEALCGLALVSRDEMTAASQMVRMAMAWHGLTATWEALASLELDNDQLCRLAVAWEPVDLLGALESGYRWERAMLIQFKRSRKDVHTGPSAGTVGLVQEPLLEPIYRWSAENRDLLFEAQVMQRSIEAIRMCRTRAPLVQIEASVSELKRECDRRAGLFGRYRYLWAQFLGQGLSIAAHVETTRQMALAAIGVERHRLRYGNVPGSLAELVPEFLSELPWDYFAAAPLRYRRVSATKFVLWSVGENCRDDGGDPTPMAGKSAGLWEGLDAVWPRAMPTESER